jgi:predicted MarR family transcription regulator
MKDKYTIELMLKTGLPNALYQDCGSLEAFKRWLSVVMMIAVSKQLTITENIYLYSINKGISVCLS